MFRKAVSIAVMAVMVTGYLIFLKVYTSQEQNEVPVIGFDEEHIEMSVSEDESRLLDGVHAYDAEDGDLTDQILIDSISPFDDQQRRTVRYVVFDSNNRPAQAERTLTYTDYTPPVISLTGSLIVDNLSEVQLSRLGTAQSSVDGDITNRMNVKIGSLEENSVRMDLTVSDSTGTEAVLTVDCDYDRNLYLADIQLKDYLLRLPAGTDFDLRSNIQDIQIGKQSNMQFLDQVSIQTSVDFNTPGTYEVYYFLNSDTGSSGRCKGIVVIQ